MIEKMRHGWAAEWQIDLTKLNFEFSSKPIVIGGKSMEYYGLRQAGRDIDLVITNDDYQRLAAQYPEYKREIWSDLGVCIHEFEIWRSIALYDYDFFIQGAVEEENCFVLSLDKLLFTRILARREEKHRRDLELLIDRTVYTTLEDRMRYLASATLEEMIARAALIAIGTVVGHQSSEHNALVYTRSLLKVEEVWQAPGSEALPTEIRVMQTGGVVGKYHTDPFPSAPLLNVGSRYLLFLERAGSDFNVIGLRQGMAEVNDGMLHHRWPHDAMAMELNQAKLGDL
ncbi:MAG: hypothetical protein ACM3ZQ_06565, partial [Bacillota bacterium]